MKLFIYSLVWRSSISKLFETTTFKLSKDVEETIRDFISTNLKSNKASLLELLNEIENIPLYHSWNITLNQKRNRGFHEAFSQFHP